MVCHHVLSIVQFQVVCTTILAVCGHSSFKILFVEETTLISTVFYYSRRLALVSALSQTITVCVSIPDDVYYDPDIVD